jgi:hypothetical protein
VSLLDVLGPAVLTAAIMVLVSIVALARVDRRLKTLLVVGIVLHVLGAILYSSVVGRAYGGGDYLLYLQYGRAYAERLSQLDFAMFTHPDEWLAGKWMGTQFVLFPSGIIGALLGPSVMVQFIAFALLSLVGLLCFSLAFHRAHPEIPVSNYLRWLVLFPSLWFWPSAPGKESLMLLGAGLTVLGYGGHSRINWPMLGLGLLLVFAIRPQVAMVFFAALLLAPWLAAGQRWSVRRVIQGIALATLAVVGMGFASESLGMSGTDTAGITAYLESHGKTYDTGGSDIDTAAVGWTGVPVALATVWLRPFPWEAKSMTANLAVLEIVALWCAILTFWRSIVRSLKQWRENRLLRLAIPFLLMYSVSAGMTMWNLGILARQRTLLFPFLFLLFEAIPCEPGGRSRWRRSRRSLTHPLTGSSLA